MQNGDPPTHRNAQTIKGVGKNTQARQREGERERESAVWDPNEDRMCNQDRKQHAGHFQNRTRCSESVEWLTGARIGIVSRDAIDVHVQATVRSAGHRCIS